MHQFKENSTVCFAGDSITCRGWWMRSVYEYYRINRGIKLEMYNCGVEGDTATKFLSRLDETVLCHNPTDVVIAFGMNDVCHELYDSDEPSDEIIKARRGKIECGLLSLRKLASDLISKGIGVIFCTPTPYDELTVNDEVRCKKGIQDALGEISRGIKEICLEYDLKCVDFRSFITEVMERGASLGESPIEADRVHPKNEIQELMAQLFLKNQGFDIQPETDMEVLKSALGRQRDEWEEKRYELERKAKQNDLINWSLFSPEKNRDILLKKAKEYLEGKNVDAYIAGCIRNYFETCAQTKGDMQKLVEHTKSIYGAV